MTKSELERIVALGKLTNSDDPDATFELNGIGPRLLPPLAQKLLDIEELCDEAGKHVNVEAVRDILER